MEFARREAVSQTSLLPGKGGTVLGPEPNGPPTARNCVKKFVDLFAV